MTEIKKYALYGAGEYGRAAYHVLSTRGGQIACWIDGNSDKWGTKLFGKPIVSLDEYNNLYSKESTIILTCGVKNQKEIEARLNKAGIHDYQVFDRFSLYKRKRLISYCNKNDLEDIVLFPVFDDIASRLFYIDVGCNDPCQYSVTKLYYDMGARGINIDALQEYIDMANIERRRDINICTGISEKQGKTELFINSGLSTLISKYAEKGGFIGKREIETNTLTDICKKYVPDNQVIHLLKIDVEGFEPQVIRSLDWKKYRPWVLCIESTEPGTDIPCYDAWEDDVLAAGYIYAFKWGVNRYYVAKEKKELANKFLTVDEILKKYYVFHAALERM